MQQKFYLLSVKKSLSIVNYKLFIKTPLSIVNYKLLLILLFNAQLFIYNAQAQINPISVTLRLIPPYSTEISTYSSNERLQVILLLRDLTAGPRDVRVTMEVEVDGRVLMRTSPFFNPAPLSLLPGQPYLLSGSELAPYLESQNLDFVGYDRVQYERSGGLPEGMAKITFQAWDYYRPNVPLSNEGFSFYFLSKNEVPIINTPACGSGQNPRQPIVFSWLPRHTANPQLAGQVEYELQLFEVRPAGRNHNDVVQSTMPVYSTRTNFTQLVYRPGIGDLDLIEDMEYAWRVQAIDPGGRHAFRNNGYSEVCSFFYKETLADFIPGAVADFRAEALTSVRIKFNWQADPNRFEGYRVYYRRVEDPSRTGGDPSRTGRDWNYKTIENAQQDQLELFNFVEEYTYEARIQGKKEGLYGPYSELITFTMPPKKIVKCDPASLEEEDPKADMSAPLLELYPNIRVNVSGVMMTITEWTNHGNGWYSGKGFVSPSFTGGANAKVLFTRCFIDTNRVETGGDVIGEFSLSSLVSEEEEEEENKKEELRERNRAQWQGVDFYPEVIGYDFEIKRITFDPERGEVTILRKGEDAEVNTEIPVILAENPGQAVIIEDSNGDQWVIDKEGKVHAVKGGGLGREENPGNEFTMEGLMDRGRFNLSLVGHSLHRIKNGLTYSFYTEEEEEKGPAPSWVPDTWEQVPDCLQDLPEAEIKAVKQRIDIHRKDEENLQAFTAVVEAVEENKALLDRLAARIKPDFIRTKVSSLAFLSLTEDDKEELDRMLCPYLLGDTEEEEDPDLAKNSLVLFRPNAAHRYGFDKNEIAAYRTQYIRDTYNGIQNIKVPYISVRTNQVGTVDVRAKFQKNDTVRTVVLRDGEEFIVNQQFMTNQAQNSFLGIPQSQIVNQDTIKSHTQNQSINFTGTPIEFSTNTLQARADSTEGTLLGRAIVCNYDQQELRVKLILVHDSTNNLYSTHSDRMATLAEIQTYLNQTYKQSVVQWAVAPTVDTINVDYDDNRDQMLDATNTRDYTDEQNAIMNHYKANSSYYQNHQEKEDYHLFLVDNPNKPMVQGKEAKNLFGMMTMGEDHFGFIHVDECREIGGTKLQWTIAHELGHSFGLCHPNDNISMRELGQQSTNGDGSNLMKSPGGLGKLLRRWQWSIIQGIFR